MISISHPAELFIDALPLSTLAGHPHCLASRLAQPSDTCAFRPHQLLSPPYRTMPPHIRFAARPIVFDIQPYRSPHGRQPAYSLKLPHSPSPQYPPSWQQAWFKSHKPDGLLKNHKNSARVHRTRSTSTGSLHVACTLFHIWMSSDVVRLCF